jgi:murein L,D-transpeptidase YcbB/YkuD
MLRRLLVGILATTRAIGLAAALGLWLVEGQSSEQLPVAASVVIDIPDNPPDLQDAQPAMTASLPEGAAGTPAAVTPSPGPQANALAIDAVRAKLQDAALRKDAHADDLVALDAFYAERTGPALWMSETGLSEAGQAVMDELAKADDWGLAAAALDIPAAPGSSASADELATAEIALSLAVLRYARYAKGGRTIPTELSKNIDQQLALADPKTVLADIATQQAPDEYLRALHPKHEQFQNLHQALIKVRADGAKAKQADIDRLIANMERWRWMPAELGPRHVQINVPEFMATIVKDGQVAYSEKVVVGKPVYATPVFSADMKTIVFNPEWTVPQTIIKEDLLPRLRKKPGMFDSKTAHLEVLKEHKLKVRYKDRPVDPSRIDWSRVNMGLITFIQAPGRDNALGKVKFLYPNEHAVYMHDTIKRGLFDKEVRVEGHHCPRVDNPEKFATALLREDKGWGDDDVKKVIAKGHDQKVELDHPIPVHTTYFTAVADADGKVKTFGDVYKLDAIVTKALTKDPPKAPAVAGNPPPPERAPQNGVASSAP